MKFRKINDYTIECLVTREDMDEYDISVDDFLKNQEKVTSFMKKLLELSSKELDFIPDEGVVSMQISPDGNEGLRILLSTRQLTGKDLLDCVQNMLSQNRKSEQNEDLYLSDIDENEEDDGKDDSVDFIDVLKKIQSMAEKQKHSGENNSSKHYKEEMDDKKKAGKEPGVSEFGNLNERNDGFKKIDTKSEETPVKKDLKQNRWNKAKMYYFENYQKLERFCKIANGALKMKCQLLKVESFEGYFLYFDNLKMSQVELAALCEMLTEYGKLYSENPLKIQYILEHAKVIIRSDAINIIKSVS